MGRVVIRKAEKKFGYTITDDKGKEHKVKAEHDSVEEALVALGEDKNWDSSYDVVVDDEETVKQMRENAPAIATFQAQDPKGDEGAAAGPPVEVPAAQGGSTASPTPGATTTRATGGTSGNVTT